MDKYLSDNFLIQNGLKKGDALSPLLFIFSLGYSTRKVQKNPVGLKLNGTYCLLPNDNDVNLLGYNIDTMKKNTESLIDACKEVGLEVNAKMAKCKLLFHYKKKGT
jgi:hypothetical protein